MADETRYGYGELKQEDLEKRTVRAKKTVMERLEEIKGERSWPKFLEQILPVLENTRHHI